MNGAQDMGGVHGFGAVLAEPDEPVFHAEWERRVLALTLAMGATGEWNLDASRFARESRPPSEYLSKSYYEIWLAGLERLLAERGLVAPDEIAAGRSLKPAKPVRRTLAAGDVAGAVSRGSPTNRDAPQPARFEVGDRVRAKNLHPVTHTRLPRYARGHVGTIARVHGCHIFPDTHAHGHGANPQWLYTVSFDGRELWGAEADPTVAVSVDAFEPYLDPAP
ncbi:MAG: nitrile hydratase subunit beta [Solirubrobacteraceae bacterium]